MMRVSLKSGSCNWYIVGLVDSNTDFLQVISFLLLPVVSPIFRFLLGVPLQAEGSL